MKFRKGDTLIEVLLSIAVFATVMLIGLTTMNNGMSRALASLQLTMARNAMDTQAEALRFSNTAFMAEYGNSNNRINSQVAQLWQNNLTTGTQGSATRLEDCSRGTSAFVISRNDMSYHNDRIKDALTYPRVVYGNDVDSNALTNEQANYHGSEGIWVEKVHAIGARYYDFHIRACWLSPGSNINTTLGTIVRLYDPRG
jgi:prepilin-type cleavage/methylation N-terminal domain protein